jgi:type III restriction enzyme
MLNGSNVIIVATMQAFKQEDINRLNVYKQNSDMDDYFQGIHDPSVVGNKSLVDMLRMRHPFIIVDEAHNQGTPLAFETLSRFEPSAILELTATPDRKFQPSNVLFSVGASSLQAAEMIKMPLELVRRGNWQDALRDAIACLNKLQLMATSEPGEYLRPIMLIQAERKDIQRETFVPERVKQSLKEDFGIPEEEIAIATGAIDEIGDEDILTQASRKRFIITIDKLREGWDCPFAYVLCSFRNTNSSTAAEQILGRILRMPFARKKTQPKLNESYAFVTSSDFQATIQSLRDGLVKNGFERQETRDLIQTTEPDPEDLFSITDSITFESPEIPDGERLPAALQEKVDVEPESGSITLKGHFTAKQIEDLEEVFQTDGGRECARKAVAQLGTPRARRQKSPAEQGELFHVPLLAFRQGELWEPFEETHLLQGDWRLLDYECELTEAEFKKPELSVEGGKFLIQDEAIKFQYFDNIEAQLGFFEFQGKWSQIQLVSWLERNIPDESVLPDEKAVYLNKAVRWLTEKRALSLEELTYSRFRLRAALEERMKGAKRHSMKVIHLDLLRNEDLFNVDERCEMIFAQGRYAYDRVYVGFRELPKHFFPQIGNLAEDGEEFECADFLARQLDGVLFWVRNVERKPTSFSLQTSTDRFYPDFICKLDDGRILIVEYKRSNDWTNDDSKEKRLLGELWEGRSHGKGLFIMPRGKDWDAIRSKVGA